MISLWANSFLPQKKLADKNAMVKSKLLRNDHHRVRQKKQSNETFLNDLLKQRRRRSKGPFPDNIILPKLLFICSTFCPFLNSKVWAVFCFCVCVIKVP
jgi:hypothetical protein